MLLSSSSRENSSLDFMFQVLCSFNPGKLTRSKVTWDESFLSPVKAALYRSRNGSQGKAGSGIRVFENTVETIENECCPSVRFA